MRVGMGYDVHRLTDNRRLILGGVEIPSPQGLLGHSDADVVVHAIMDALLGAAGLGDIGKHFPDTDEAYAGISSMKLLESVGGMLAKENYLIENIDATIVAQKPKLLPFIPQMEQCVAHALRIQGTQVNIKATTEEGLGFTGTQQGIAAYAVCALSSLFEGSFAVESSFSQKDSGAAAGRCGKSGSCPGCPNRKNQPA